MSANASHDSIQNLISEWDTLIRQGQLSRAAEQINKFNIQEVPRNLRKAFANLCRRAGLIERGLRVLQPLVRQQGQTFDKATPEETCEYGALLMRNGSLIEATNLLASIDSKKFPLSLLYQGFCHVSAWDYEAAAPIFEALLKSDVDDYSKLIALVNLGSSLAAIGRHQEAMDIINQAIDSASKTEARRLIGNCLEVRSRIHMDQNDFARAREDLNQARDGFDNNKNYDLLLISKKFAILQAMEEKSLEPLQQFKTQAITGKHWESVREADYFSVKIHFDRKAFDHLIIGSPMPAYRKRVLKELPHEPSRAYVFGKEGSRVLDLESGHGGAEEALNPGKKIHSVLGALVADFYAPRDSGTLFSMLYPDEYFDIGSSPNRVRQAIHRARRWLREHNIPCEIQFEDGRYQLVVQGEFGIRVPYDKQENDTIALRFLELKRVLPLNQPFTAEDACAALNMSKSTFHRLAEHGLKTQQLRRLGMKRSTVYILET